MAGFESADVVVDRPPTDTGASPVDDIPRGAEGVGDDTTQVLIRPRPRVTDVKPDSIETDPTRRRR